VQLPNALETCVTAYRNGACHRDIHATLLGRLALTHDLVRGPEADALVRPLFASVASRPAEDATYVAETVLSEISGKAWQPSFLVDIIGNSWAFIPQVANQAFHAVCNARGPGVEAGSLARALANILEAARMLTLPVNERLAANHTLTSPWRNIDPTRVEWTSFLGQPPHAHQRKSSRARPPAEVCVRLECDQGSPPSRRTRGVAS
jgi:hypothetical protein